MISTLLRALSAAGAASAIVASLAGPAVASTPPLSAPTLTPSRQSASTRAVPTTDPACATTKPLTLFNINDFHGRIEAAPKLFTVVEELRATQPGVALLSAGDNIGASTFVALVDDDLPTIDVLNAAGLQVSAPGNHEFDGGWAKLRDKYIPRATFTYVAANMTGTTLAPYKVITVDGVRVAVVGAELGELRSMVSPAGIQGIVVSPEVAAVNKTADAIKSQNLADVVVAEVHNNIKDGYAPSVDAVFNGHTHESYAVTGSGGQPIVQAASYGTQLGRVDLAIGAGNVVCGTPRGSVVAPAATANLALPAIAKVNTIVETAKAKATVLGAQELGTACTALTRGVDLTNPQPGTNRAVESTLSDLAAQVFYDRASNGDKTFIGMQNPGGIRADLAKGVITYQQAQAVMPFANTIKTTQLTGAQVKKVLEQQWQRDASGNVPSRPYLQMGLSDNVTYTYDEARPEGDRITSILVNGAPIEPGRLYTIGSGNFLIEGGDNFFELAKGVNTRDTGMSDLTEWSDWIRTTKNVCPGFERQAVSLRPAATATSATTGAVTPLACGASSSWVAGQPSPGGLALDTLNFNNGAPADTALTATAGGVTVGKATITNGVATLTITNPAESNGTGGPVTVTSTNGTTFQLPGLRLAACPKTQPAPGASATPSPSATPTVAAPADATGDETGSDELAATGSGSSTGLLLLGLSSVVAGAVAIRKR